MVMNDNKFLYAQEWTESEAGWGTRPDGICVARDKTVLKEYTEMHLAQMRAREKKMYGDRTPAEYSYPNGAGIFIAECSKAVFDSVPEVSVRWFTRKSELTA
jgi:hypothetical protein